MKGLNGVLKLYMYNMHAVCRLGLSTTWLRKLLVFGKIKAGPMINDVISGVSELFCKPPVLTNCSYCL